MVADAAGAQQIPCGGEEFALQHDQLCDIGRRATPAGLRAATQCAEPGARGIDEDAVVAGGESARAAVGDVHVDG